MIQEKLMKQQDFIFRFLLTTHWYICLNQEKSDYHLVHHKKDLLQHSAKISHKFYSILNHKSKCNCWDLKSDSQWKQCCDWVE